MKSVNLKITLNNYNVMRTNLYSKIARTAVVLFFAIASAPSLLAQFASTATVTQTAVEERKGLVSTYTVPGPATDEYSWEVVGGTVTSPAAGVTGSGTGVDPYVVPFTAGQTQIEVQWPADDSTITSTTGNVSVQRRVAHATVQCPSQIQSMDVTLWSNPTISIQDADYEICSGDATNGDITVAFTGAPNFDYKYTITDLDGNVSAEQVVTGITTATTTIAIPANLVNGTTTVDQTYIVTITDMNDTFTGSGTILDGTITITVHPTIETGDITSDNSLTRR